MEEASVRNEFEEKRYFTFSWIEFYGNLRKYPSLLMCHLNWNSFYFYLRCYALRKSDSTRWKRVWAFEHRFTFFQEYSNSFDIVMFACMERIRLMKIQLHSNVTWRNITSFVLLLQFLPSFFLISIVILSWKLLPLDAMFVGLFYLPRMRKNPFDLKFFYT